MRVNHNPFFFRQFGLCEHTKKTLVIYSPFNATSDVKSVLLNDFAMLHGKPLVSVGLGSGQTTKSMVSFVDVVKGMETPSV
jgi:hypothetical protein